MEVCLKNFDNNRTIFLITFDSGIQEYSNAAPASFNFSSNNMQQIFQDTLGGVGTAGRFAFINRVPPNSARTWHAGASDHTDNDKDGYMYLIDISTNTNSELFRTTVHNLLIGQSYQFSAYLANVVKNSPNLKNPNVRFEVQTSAPQQKVIVQCNTNAIPQYDTLTWRQYGVSFNASNDSVTLLIISNVGERDGNDLIIDDIELRLLPKANYDYYTSGQ